MGTKSQHIPQAWYTGPAAAQVLAEYRTARVQLDREIARLTGVHRRRLACRPGCDHCCELTSVLPVEATVLVQALTAVAPAIRAHLDGESGRCPLLTTAGRCAVYADRPFICRSHGLPVGYGAAHAGCIEVSACARNFSPDTPFAFEEILLMDPYTSELHRLSGLLVGSGPIERIPLADLLPATGSLPASG